MFDFGRVDRRKGVGRGRKVKNINRVRITTVFFYPARL